MKRSKSYKDPARAYHNSKLCSDIAYTVQRYIQCVVCRHFQAHSYVVVITSTVHISLLLGLGTEQY